MSHNIEKKSFLCKCGFISKDMSHFCSKHQQEVLKVCPRARGIFWLFAKTKEQEADSGHPSGLASFIQETHIDSAAILWHEDKRTTLFNHLHFCRFNTVWDEYSVASFLIQRFEAYYHSFTWKIQWRQIKARQNVTFRLVFSLHCVLYLLNKNKVIFSSPNLWLGCFRSPCVMRLVFGTVSIEANANAI